MATKSVSQISALHLAIAAGGGVLIYAALQDMTPADALKEIASGKTPRPIEAKKSSLTGGAKAQWEDFTPSTSAGAPLATAAAKYLGVPYRWGGTTKAGLDCSGLVVLAFQDAFGVTPPRTTYGQEPWKMLTKVSRESLAMGDLVFWPGHVAIYVGNGKVIHAPKPGSAVKYSGIDEAGPTRTPSSYRRYKGAATKTSTSRAV